MISLRDVSFKYKKNSEKPTLNKVTFDIYDGSFHAFIGENGAGKSTTIKLIAGLINEYQGEVTINGKDPNKDDKARLNLAYIPDKAIFPTDLTVYEYIYNMAALTRNDFTNIKEEMDWWLEKLGINDKANVNPNHLSAGQKKKVLLVKCIVEKAKIIILDEPAANLDPTTRMEFFNLLKYLTSIGTTIFISTHIIEEIKKYADFATFIKQGHILWSGPVQDDQIIDWYEYLYSVNLEVIEREHIDWEYIMLRAFLITIRTRKLMNFNCFIYEIDEQ